LEDVLCNADIAPSPLAQQPLEPYLTWDYGLSLPQPEYAFYPLTNDKKGKYPQLIKAT
jgi:hypothetical protein